MNEKTETEVEFSVNPVVSLVDDRHHVLKHGDTFAVIGRHGDIRPVGVENHGLFRHGTRFLSRLVLDLNGQPPVLLSSEVSQDTAYLSVDLTNPRMEMPSGDLLRQDSIYVHSTAYLWENVYYQKLDIHHYGLNDADITLRLRYEADFADIFEVRGTTRERRGDYGAAQVGRNSVLLPYHGLDDIERETRLTFSSEPDSITERQALFRFHLEPQATRSLYLTVACRYAGEESAPLQDNEAFARLHQRLREQHESTVSVETSDTQFNAWVSASKRDILLLLTDTPHGLYPYAGVPWFSTVFGRDGIIAALQTLWMYPEIARGVLRYLAAKQATEVDPSRDAEPGKILHEERRGEMANTREVPFGRYYGSIDSTPLFLVLAGRYYERTGDTALLNELWSSFEAALNWIDIYGDADGDGFVEYERKNEAGLRQQGWKDSDDSVFYASGEMARPGIALCEVQGYVYEAKRLIAVAAEALGKDELATKLRAQAEKLRQHFVEAFWSEELGTYALALDGDKQPCLVRSSNAGHCLFSGIADPAHAQRMTDLMLGEDYFSGWGIRTIAQGEARYNPMSYHNGSIWPHDNSMIGYGMGRYGDKHAAAAVLTSLFEVSHHYELRRLPELFCGFERQPQQGPTFYPVACLPQAWAAGSVFLLLQACLGLEIDGVKRKLTFSRPVLPAQLNKLTLYHLTIGEAAIDVALQRTHDGIRVTVLRQEGELELVVN